MCKVFPVVCVGVVRRSAPSDLAPPTLPLGNTHCTVHCTPTAQCTAHPLHHCTVQTGRTWCLEISQENPKSILGGKSQLQKKNSILNFYTTLQVSTFKITIHWVWSLRKTTPSVTYYFFFSIKLFTFVNWLVRGGDSKDLWNLKISVSQLDVF